VMDKQELARELGHPGAQTLLSGSMARLAYNGHDGFPRVIPVGFYWTGERIVVSTAPTSPKARALSSRPQVAVTIDTGSTPDEAKALLVRGLATLETVDGITDEYLAAARRSMEEPQLAEFERNVRSTYKQMVRISIEPRWARFYDFGAGRLPAFLANLVNDVQPDSGRRRIVEAICDPVATQSQPEPRRQAFARRTRATPPPRSAAACERRRNGRTTDLASRTVSD